MADSRGPPVPKQRTKFLSVDELSDESPASARRPPPRPPPPRIPPVGHSFESSSEVSSTNGRADSPRVEYAENPIYFKLDEIQKALDADVDSPPAPASERETISPSRVAPPIPPSSTGLPPVSPPDAPRPLPIEPPTSSMLVQPVYERVLSPNDHIPFFPSSEGKVYPILSTTPSYAEVLEIPYSLPPSSSTWDEDPIEICDSEELEEESMVDGQFVCFSGPGLLFQSEKKKKKTFIRLMNNVLAFYANEDADLTSPVSGPHNLGDALFIRQNASSTITIHFQDGNDVNTIRFSVEDNVEAWLLLLVECYMSEIDLLREGYVKEWCAMGRVWVRQGASSDWKLAAVALCPTTLFYVYPDRKEVVYELDMRKAHSLRTKLEKHEWCPSGKKKGQEGPALITLDGGSLAVEAEYPLTTRMWKEVLDEVIRTPQSSFSSCRLTLGDVPVAIDKCIRFIGLHGIHSEGIYRKNGNMAKQKALLKQLQEDPHSVQLTVESDESVYAVADALRHFIRRMDSPLFPTSSHSTIFSILDDDADATRDARLAQVMESFPVVHYATIRRIIGHLKDITDCHSTNLASVENVSKVFGPTLFNVDSTDFSQLQPNMGKQIGTIVHFVNNFARIFKETPRESFFKEAIQRARENQSVKVQRRPEGVLIAVHLWRKDNRPFNIQSNLVADEVLTQAFTLRGVMREPNTPYAVFEVLCGGSLIRRLNGGETMASIVLQRWIDWKCSQDGYLLINHDEQPFDPDNVSPSSGKVRVLTPHSRFSRAYELKVEKEDLHFCKSGKITRHYHVKDLLFFRGTTRKAVTSYNLTMFERSMPELRQLAGITISFKNEENLTKFLNMILLVTHGREPAILHI